MRDIAYAFVAPLLVAGVTAFIALLAASAFFPRFPRPYLTAWSFGSLFLGSALFADGLAHGHSVAVALAWALATTVGLAALVPLIWFRLHMWEIFGRRRERQEQDERNARYRPKSFVE